MTGDEYQADPYRYDEGWVDYLDVTQPAAGTSAAVSVPGQFGVRVIAALATLVTSATVANRLLSLDYISANGVTRVRNPVTAVQAASLTHRYHWNSAFHAGMDITNGPAIVPVNDLLVPPGWSVQFTVDTVQAADQLSSLSLVVLKVPTGA